MIQVEEIRKLHWEDGLTVREVGERLNVSYGVIRYAMRKFSIPGRSNRENGKLRRERSRKKNEALLEEIKRLYWQEGLSLRAIEKRLGLGGKCRIAHWMESAGIPRRSRQEIAEKERYARRRTSTGYILVYAPDHPHAQRDGHVFEHIIIWEQTHNRQLTQGWIVHHVNGIKDDNRPDNLMALQKGRHYKIIPEMAKKIRALEIENRQLRRALEDSQSIFYISEN